MYICSQRVVKPGHDSPEGINTFYYVHGPREWKGLPPSDMLPESNPGVLEDELLELSPPGNRVRSYLDIVAPDGTRANAIVAAALHPPAVLQQFPATWIHGDVWCRFAVEGALASSWRNELHDLAYRIVALWRKRSATYPSHSPQ